MRLLGLTEPFRRATGRVRSDEHPGVGLGLAIVHSIVRAHDGTLELAPGPAGGLVVTVRLPRAAHARDADATGAWSPDRVAYGPTAAKRRPSLR